jgi:hypothetical protein
MTASANDPHVGLIVEGQGDANSLPLLLRKWLEMRADYRDIIGKPAICNGRERALVAEGLEGYVAAVAARPGCLAVLVVLDAERDASCELGPRLLERARAITRLPVAVALAERNWEDWIYSSIETLRIDDPPPAYDANQSGISVIKQSLKPAKYVKPTWQPRLTARVDIELARPRSASLNRMLEKFDELIVVIPDDGLIAEVEDPDVASFP